MAGSPFEAEKSVWKTDYFLFPFSYIYCILILLQEFNMNVILFLITGLAAGVLGGFLGIGGGVIMVPVLIYLAGY